MNRYGAVAVDPIVCYFWNPTDFLFSDDELDFCVVHQSTTNSALPPATPLEDFSPSMNICVIRRLRDDCFLQREACRAIVRRLYAAVGYGVPNPQFTIAVSSAGEKRCCVSIKLQ